MLNRSFLYVFAPTLVGLSLGLAVASAAETTKADVDTLLDQASRAANAGESARAVELLDQALKAAPDTADAYYVRGRERFRLGRIKESVADFDKYVALRPELASRQWERGIALFYAGEFDKGAKQFELYQTFHDNDVENSVWRFLCLAPVIGAEKARATMLPIQNDRRVPMMQVYEMFRGRTTPEEVLATCRQGDPPPEVLAGRLFYAELYVGLYLEATGERAAARGHLLKAADDHKSTRTVNRYMWDVARIHADRVRQPAPEKK